MGKYLIDRSKVEGGFTILELVVYVFILSIVLSTAVFGFASMNETSLLNNSAAQIKSALEHGLNIAGNENQKVTMNFYNAGTAGHPSSYAYMRVDGTQEVPASGVSYSTESGVYYIKLLAGDTGVSIASDVTVVFDPQGTIMTITPASIVIGYSGKSRTISITANGEATY